jgi:hypothetical protein
MATTGQTAPVFPPGRYGRRRDPSYARRRRWMTWVVGALVALFGVAIAVKLYNQYADPPYAVTIVTVKDISEHGVTVTFDVRVPAGEGATCTVEGHTREGRLVGRATVDVPPGGPDQTMVRVTYTLATEQAPVTGEVPGCGPRE